MFMCANALPCATNDTLFNFCSTATCWLILHALGLTGHPAATFAHRGHMLKSAGNCGKFVGSGTICRPGTLVNAIMHDWCEANKHKGQHLHAVGASADEQMKQQPPSSSAWYPPPRATSNMLRSRTLASGIRGRQWATLVFSMVAPTAGIKTSASVKLVNGW